MEFIEEILSYLSQGSICATITKFLESVPPGKVVSVKPGCEKYTGGLKNT